MTYQIKFDPELPAISNLVASNLMKIAGTETLYRWGQNAGVILKRVSSTTEALACGGVYLMIAGRPPGANPTDPLQIQSVTGLAGKAMTHFSISDPMIGVQVEPTFSVVTGDFVSPDGAWPYVDTNTAYTARPVRVSTLVQGEVGYLPWTDCIHLVMGWVTGAITGSFFQIHEDGLPETGGFVPSNSGIGDIFNSYSGGQYCGGVLVQTPFEINYRALINSKRADFISGASGDALTALTAAFDEHVAALPIKKVILQPLVVGFTKSGGLTIGLSTVNEGVDGSSSSIEVPDDGFLFKYTTWTDHQQDVFTSRHPYDHVTAMAALPVRNPILSWNPTPGCVDNSIVLPSVKGLDVSHQPLVSASLPGRLSGSTAAPFLGSAFPIQYATGYGVDALDDLEVYSPLHPPQNVGQTPNVKTVGTGPTATVQVTPRSNFEPKFSWGTQGPGVYGEVMGTFAAIDSLARNKARLM